SLRRNDSCGRAKAASAMVSAYSPANQSRGGPQMPTLPAPISTHARGVDRGLTTYGDEGFSRFLRRAFLASAGWDDVDLNRPVIGIADTTSDFVPCHRDLPGIIDAIRVG